MLKRDQDLNQQYNQQQNDDRSKADMDGVRAHSSSSVKTLMVLFGVSLRWPLRLCKMRQISHFHLHNIEQRVLDSCTPVQTNESRLWQSKQATWI